MSYETQCMSEALRLSKQCRVSGMAVCQRSESRVALLLADGRLVFLQLAPAGKVSRQGLSGRLQAKGFGEAAVPEHSSRRRQVSHGGRFY